MPKRKSTGTRKNCTAISYNCGAICLSLHKTCRKGGDAVGKDRVAKLNALATALESGGPDTRKGLGRPDPNVLKSLANVKPMDKKSEFQSLITVPEVDARYTKMATDLAREEMAEQISSYNKKVKDLSVSALKQFGRQNPKVVKGDYTEKTHYQVEGLGWIDKKARLSPSEKSFLEDHSKQQKALQSGRQKLSDELAKRTARAKQEILNQRLTDYTVYGVAP